MSHYLPLPTDLQPKLKSGCRTCCPRRCCATAATVILLLLLLKYHIYHTVCRCHYVYLKCVDTCCCVLAVVRGVRSVLIIYFRFVRLASPRTRTGAGAAHRGFQGKVWHLAFGILRYYSSHFVATQKKNGAVFWPLCSAKHLSLNICFRKHSPHG